MELLLTGSTGFVGAFLASKLASHKLIEVGRNRERCEEKKYLYIEKLNGETSFQLDSFKCDVAIHCAARVHVMDDDALNPLQAFREVNTYGTLNLAQQAANAGVKRFIFISSIKVNGESTESGHPFKPDDSFIPTDPYGLSKYEAEVGLRKIAKDTGMEVIIIRPPLVYGPGVKANFASMMKWVNKGLPLPLGGIKGNKRSLVSVDNLVDLIITCIDHPNAANQTFLVSDNEDVSTVTLLQNMASALGVKSRLITIPPSWINFTTKLISKPSIYKRLCGSLQVDISKTTGLLNWNPPCLSQQSMKKTAENFLTHSANKESL